MRDNRLFRFKLILIALILAIITWFYVHGELLR